MRAEEVALRGPRGSSTSRSRVRLQPLSKLNGRKIRIIFYIDDMGRKTSHLVPSDDVIDNLVQKLARILNPPELLW